MPAGMSTATSSAWRQIQREAPAFEACTFYHSVGLPSQGLVRGYWDLRPTVDAYLGGFDFAGKSVLEVGPASGFLSFHMERAGAVVTAIEPPMERLWDVVPLPGFDMAAWREQFTRDIQGVRNSFWYLHHHYRSSVRLLEANPEHLSADAGDFDVGLFAAVLLHCRSPISILEGCARRVRSTVIVTDLYDATLGELPVCHLLPRPNIPQVDTWWALTPAFVVNALALMGFPHARVTTHHHKREVDGLQIPMFSVVANRH
ncbi:O-methyltransferase [Variovorax sp. EL159]|nr:O-methyltransferase [Variovorax sp. EL159]